MKKLLYLCVMMTLSLNMTAQIDNNWTLIIEDDFHDFLGWDANSFKEIDRYPGYQRTWECFARELYTGITKKPRPNAYQTAFAYLRADNKMILKAEHISNTPLTCGIDYFVPSGKQCPDGIEHNFDAIYYFSGMLETRFKYWFGYYEIKCKMPVHLGAKTSFWLYGEGSDYYEEIDIFENTEKFFPDQPARGYSCGIHYNPNSPNYTGANHSICSKYLLAEGTPDVTQEHTYACEWLPDRVRWYFDEEVIFECNDRTEIPQHPMRLKVTHPVTVDAIVEGSPIWLDSDSVTISHIKYYQLEFDCDSDVTIRDISGITGYQPGVKHSIVMGALGNLIVPDTTNIVFRASESITIDNELTIPLGAQVTMIIQECPETE